MGDSQTQLFKQSNVTDNDSNDVFGGCKTYSGTCFSKKLLLLKSHAKRIASSRNLNLKARITQFSKNCVSLLGQKAAESYLVHMILTKTVPQLTKHIVNVFEKQDGKIELSVADIEEAARLVEFSFDI